MSKACGVLLALLFATNVFAQSRLTIDKLDRKDIKAVAKEVPFSTLLEGTVDDPDLAVYVMVYEPAIKAWRSYRATVNSHKPDPAGGYRWRAICHFGEFDGRGVGLSYLVRTIAVERSMIGKMDFSRVLQEGVLQTNALTVQRVRK